MRELNQLNGVSTSPEEMMQALNQIRVEDAGIIGLDGNPLQAEKPIPTKPDKNAIEQEKHTVKMKDFNVIFSTTIKQAGEDFKSKWNVHNPEDPIDIRFLMHQNKYNGKTVKAVAMLTFEIKRGGQWTLASRAVVRLAAVKMLKEQEVEYTYDLWSQMFSEITQIGFISTLNYFNAKEDSQLAGSEGDSSKA